MTFIIVAIYQGIFHKYLDRKNFMHGNLISETNSVLLGK